MIVCKFLVLDRNTWYHIIVRKQMIIIENEKSFQWNVEKTNIHINKYLQIN